MLLRERGLLFHSETSAEKEFQMLSYFRLANYLRPMETNTETHIFKQNSYFEDALNLYYFDKKLRSEIFNAIQSVEIAIRSRMIDRVAIEHGAFWFADIDLASNQQMFQENLLHISKELSRSKEDFILSHYEKYDNPEFPPVWKTLEVVTFGTLSKLYTNLNDTPLKKKIANDFHIPQHIYMESWIKSLAVLRNHIAHYARVWNRRFPLSPQLPRNMSMPWINTSKVRGFKLYAQLCCLAYLQNAIHPDNDFKTNIKTLLSSYTTVNLHSMGFPDNWENEPLWQE